MKDIKTKETRKTISTLNKVNPMDHYIKKVAVEQKQQVQSKQDNDPENGSEHAIDSVISREKKTVADASFKTKKFIKQRIANKKRRGVANEEVADTDVDTKKDVATTITTEKQETIKSVIKEKERASIKTVDAKDKMSIAKKESVKVNKPNPEKTSYASAMKSFAIRKQQKKIKESTKKTSSTFRKSVSMSGKIVKNTFKVVKKAISNIHTLIALGSTTVLLLVIILFIGIFASLSSDSGVNTSMEPISKEVLEYTPIINLYAKEYGIEDYTTLIQAVMMQESGGKGNDPMQASESEYNTDYPKVPNGITDAEYSIKVGVHYLSECLKSAKAESPSDINNISLGLQGYNYGNGYISWALEHFDGYTRANAKVFSDEMKAKLQVDAYGDPEYVPHVLRYYHISSGKIVDIALSQVGNVGGKPYWEWYGFNSRVEWCACFISWCAEQAGLIENGIIPKFAYCPTGIQWFKDKGRWQNRNYVPTSGDIIFFDWENDGISDHVGIVEKVENNIIYTIEGNSIGDECKGNSYSLKNKVIFGFGITK
ncbi:MAG: lysozyme family protein [Longicatena sp.]